MNIKYKYIFTLKVFFCLVVLSFPVFALSAEEVNSGISALTESQKSRDARIFANNLDNPYAVDPLLELPSYNRGNKFRIKAPSPSTDKNKETYYSDFQVPLHPQGELLDSQPPSSLVGDGGIGQMYSIQDRPKRVEDFYRLSLRRQGFEEIKAKGFKVMAVKRIRFEKKDMALELYLSQTEEDSCKVAIIKYADKNGISRIEAEPLAFGSFPKKDNSRGSDLEDIPRPLGSVRLSGGTQKNMNNFSYTLPLSVLQARDFYLEQMPSAGWALVNEINIRQQAARYAEKHHKKQLIPNLFIGSMLNLGEIIKDSYVLDFSSESATVNFMIYPNFVNPALGSIVDITYRIVQNRGEK